MHRLMLFRWTVFEDGSPLKNDLAWWIEITERFRNQYPKLVGSHIFMSKFLRGKTLIVDSPKVNYTKIPNTLFEAQGLTPVEKLILSDSTITQKIGNWRIAGLPANLG